MKKLIFTFLLMLTTITVVFSQVPNAFNYQAVVRNSSGEIVANKTVSFRISLLKNSETGAVVYSETHSLSTNEFGLVNFKIGKGTKISGKFSPADWGEVIFTKVEFDPAGGSSFSELATTKLSSVPFAIVAQTAVNDKVDDADADPANEIQTLKLTGTLLELSNGGGSVTLPTSGSGGGDNWGAQTVKTDATLTGNGTTLNPLHAVGDGDGDDTNELQTIHLNENILTLSDDGGSVTLPTNWYKNENGVNTFDNVGIGTNNPVSKLHVEDGNLRLGDDCRIILGSPNVNSSSTQISFLNKNSYISNFATGSIYFNTKTVLGATVPAYARLKIEPAGDIKIYENLTIDKNITIKGGAPGDGKVLTSDANGLASWQTPETGSSLWTKSGDKISYDGPVGIGVVPDYDSPSLDVRTTGNIAAIYTTNNSELNPPFQAYNQNANGAAAYFRNKIRIKDGTEGAGKVLTSDANGITSWQTPATGGSLWTENGDNIYRNSGKVGIGITVPTYSLDINSSSDNSDIRIKSSFSDAHLKLDKASASDYANIVYASAGTNLFFTGLMGDNNYIIKSSSASQNGIQVSNSGNVTMYNNLNVKGKIGIGTTSPSAPIEIKSNNNPALIIGSATANSSTRPGIQFKNNGSQWIAGDDGSDEVFGFYAKWASARTHDAKLRVYGNASSSWGKYIQLTHNGTDGFISTDAGDIDITPAGKVGIKTNAPTQTLDVNGNMRVRSIPSGSGTYAIVIDSDGTFKKTSSDARLKKNVKTLDNSLDKILKLRGVTFTWKANPEYGTRIGFIAQEFEKVIPELSFTNPVDGYKGINYAEVTAVLVEAVKEQQKQIETLKAENNRLKADNNGFESRLKKLENMMTGYADK